MSCYQIKVDKLYTLDQMLRLLFISPLDLVRLLFVSGDCSRTTSIINLKRYTITLGPAEVEEAGPFVDIDDEDELEENQLPYRFKFSRHKTFVNRAKSQKFATIIFATARLHNREFDHEIHENLLPRNWSYTVVLEDC